METTISRLPNWARWVLLVPAALLGGFVVGYIVHLTNSAHASRPDAPIVFIGEFLAGLTSILAALHIASWFAPSRKKTVVVVLIVLQIIATVWPVQPTSGDLALLAGNIVGCGIGWFQLIREKRVLG